jgi:hypothetical protein
MDFSRMGKFRIMGDRYGARPYMTFSYSVSPKGHLLVAIGALLFAQDQPGVGPVTRRKIAVAIASARRDLAGLGRKARKRRRKGK